MVEAHLTVPRTSFPAAGKEALAAGNGPMPATLQLVKFTFTAGNGLSSHAGASTMQPVFPAVGKEELRGKRFKK